jgi:hypothetical protein
MSIVILTYNSNYVDYFPYHYHNHCYMLHVNYTLSLFEISHTNQGGTTPRKSPGTPRVRNPPRPRQFYIRSTPTKACFWAADWGGPRHRKVFQ